MIYDHWDYIGLGFCAFGAKEIVVKDFVDKGKPSNKGGGDDV